MIDIDFMKIALDEAERAFAKDEIPVGAVVVKNGKVISQAYNMNRELNDPTKHAEMIAIAEASSVIHNERLIDCDLYVTKEPCVMCAGAIVHARIRKLIIGTRDYKYGACGTVFTVCGNKSLNHAPEIVFGILEDESALLLKNFFKNKRK